MSVKACVVAALLAASITPALAGDFYVLGSVGRSSMKDNSKSNADAVLAAAGFRNISSSLDTTDTGYKLQLGYQYNPNFAVEAGYVDLGKEKYSATYTGGSASATAKAAGWNIAAVGIVPLNDQFSLFGKLGLIDAKVETSGTVSLGAASASANASATKWKPNYGIGATYNFTKTVGMRAEYERFQKLGDSNTTGESNVDLLSLGVVVKF